MIRVIDFLTSRSQQVKWTVFYLMSFFLPLDHVKIVFFFPPLLFVLLTAECWSHHGGHHIIKFADDSVIVSLFNLRDPDHGPVAAECFAIKVSKTRENEIDFQEQPLCYLSTEQVQQYKYLGTIIDDKLTFEQHVNAVCKKKKNKK